MSIKTIVGHEHYDEDLIAVDTLKFQSGAILEFSRNAIKEGGGNLKIIARTIECDQANPGRITWEKPEFPPHRKYGKAAAGPPHPGSSNRFNRGKKGNKGVNGIDGDSGERGAEAPNLELWVARVLGAGPEIDMVGQKGQDGGQGQEGGDGGPGQKGKKAKSGPFDCKRGGGYGGHGGDGGSGGDGGDGGDGGNGGMVFLFAPMEFHNVLDIKTNVLIQGGDGGEGGLPNKGGKRGDGGDGGNGDSPWCRNESSRRRGEPGLTGRHGIKGNKGAVGTVGSKRIVFVPAETIDHLLSTNLSLV